MIESYIPRVAAAADLSGFGRVSLTESIPVMSAMGIEVCPIPTAVLSTHTYKFDDYTFCDLTDEMEKILRHWEKLGINFDGVCTGYMGSSRQIDIMTEFIKKVKEKGGVVVIDPVLGDNTLSDAEEIYYDRMSELLCSMRDFVSVADAITPNLTEAYLLIGEPYPKGYVSVEEMERVLRKLSELGPKWVAVTSVMTSEKEMSVGVYDRESDRCQIIDCSYVNHPFHGTGDIFAAVLTGALVKGKSMFEASAMAVSFIKKAIEETEKYPNTKIEHGVFFEAVLADFFSKN